MGVELRASVLLRVSPAVDPFLDVEHVATGNLALCAEFGLTGTLGSSDASKNDPWQCP